MHRCLLLLLAWSCSATQGVDHPYEVPVCLLWYSYCWWPPYCHWCPRLFLWCRLTFVIGCFEYSLLWLPMLQQCRHSLLLQLCLSLQRGGGQRGCFGAWQWWSIFFLCRHASFPSICQYWRDCDCTSLMCYTSEGSPNFSMSMCIGFLVPSGVCFFLERCQVKHSLGTLRCHVLALWPS